MDTSHIIQLIEFTIMALAIYFSRKDRNDDTITKIFEKIENLVSEPLCKERRDGIKEDLKNVADIARGNK